jgi:hypothetical protein
VRTFCSRAVRSRDWDRDGREVKRRVFSESQKRGNFASLGTPKARIRSKAGMKRNSRSELMRSPTFVREVSVWLKNEF